MKKGDKVFIYRVDPVPGTGKYKFKFFNMYKTPKTANEKRKTFSCDKKYIRGKRRFWALPESWDDVVRSDRYNKKSWKKNKKKKQWM